MTIFEEAARFSRIRRTMQNSEAAGAFDSKILHPGDVRDSLKSFKVPSRKGPEVTRESAFERKKQAFAASAR